MKKKILLVSPYSKIKAGGISTWSKNILDYNTKNGENRIVFFNTFFKLKPNIVRSNLLRILWGIFDSVYLLSLLIIKTLWHRPKTVHYTSSASFALLKDYMVARWMKLIGANFVIHWHFGRIPELREKQNAEWKILIKVVKAAKTSVVLDALSLKALRDEGFSNVYQIPNPISEELELLARSMDFKTERIQRKDILFVGHLIPAKGIQDLVEAFCQLSSGSKLYLVGPIAKNFKDEICAQLAHCGKAGAVIFTGELSKEEVYRYMKKCEMLCLPSYTEGFPNVIIEAMAAGCPVVASRVGAVEEMIASPDYGPAGICIEPGNIAHLKITKASDIVEIFLSVYIFS